MRDLNSHIDAVQSLAPAARTGNANGSAVDLANYDGAVVVIDAGAWTDGTHTFQVEEAPDDGTGSPGTFTAVADADLDGTEPVVSDANSDGQIYKIGYHGNKRWLRVTVAVSGATNGAVYGASIVRGFARKQPV